MSTTIDSFTAVKGFCPYTLITRDGLVVPGDKNLGLLRYRDKLYAFASEEGMKDFTRSPDRYDTHISPTFSESDVKTLTNITIPQAS